MWILSAITASAGPMGPMLSVGRHMSHKVNKRDKWSPSGTGRALSRLSIASSETRYQWVVRHICCLPSTEIPPNLTRHGTKMLTKDL
jgi:hypothetical protein